MNEKISHGKWNHVLCWTALLSSWPAFIFSFTILPGIIIWLTALIVLFIRKSKLKWILIGFSA